MSLSPFGVVVPNRQRLSCRVRHSSEPSRRAPAIHAGTGFARGICAALLAGAMLWAQPQAKAAAVTGCDVADVVANALPAVVNISVVEAGRETGSTDNGLPGVKFIVGTGIIVDSSGVIITNQHVIQNAISIRVTFQDKSQVPARLLAAASLVDLAVLTVKVPKPLPTLSFDNSDAIRIGQPVIAIGNPIGVGTSVSTGTVSAVNRNLMRTPFDDFIQTDAAINPGNSGGPLLDCSGKIIGMNTALLSNNTLLGSIGLGFAMPGNDVKMVTAKLRDPRDMPNWIGIHLQDLNARLAMLFNHAKVSGAIVTGVDPDSPAAHASLVPGDIITGVSGHTMPDSRAVMRSITELPPGDPITLSVWRRDAATQVEVRGQPWPDWRKLRSEVLANPDDVARALTSGIGMSVREITPADRRDYDLGNTHGVFVDWVRPGSQADNLGLKSGDVIKQVGTRPSATPAQVRVDLAYGKPAADDLVAVLVQKKSGPVWIAFWVGGLGSQDLATDAVVPQAASAAHEASAR